MSLLVNTIKIADGIRGGFSQNMKPYRHQNCVNVAVVLIELFIETSEFDLDVCIS